VKILTDADLADLSQGDIVGTVIAAYKGIREKLHVAEQMRDYMREQCQKYLDDIRELKATLAAQEKLLEAERKQREEWARLSIPLR
jgi:flagellar motility protein MotE (MotC chaperone)